MKEGDIVASIIRHYYKSAKVFLWRANAGQFKTFGGARVQCNFAGCPDLIGFLAPSGRFIGIECKYTTKQDPKQLEFQQELESKGGLYILARSLSDVIQVLGI